MRNLDPVELATLLQQGDKPPTLVDVREAWEYELCRIAGSVHIPLGDLPARMTELDRDSQLAVICHHGMRSQMAADFLERQGYSQVLNLSGGIAAWADQIDPQMARY
jgi:rhodanese-related sulfurtransferase